MTATVKYQIADHKGKIEVPCSENETTELIIQKAKVMLKISAGFLPFGYEKWEVAERF